MNRIASAVTAIANLALCGYIATSCAGQQWTLWRSGAIALCLIGCGSSAAMFMSTWSRRESEG